MRNLTENEKIRNITIIAHVDHRKTTPVDHRVKQAGTLLRQGFGGLDTADRVMDSMDLEQERGITISSKNCAVNYGDILDA